MSLGFLSSETDLAMLTPHMGKLWSGILYKVELEQQLDITSLGITA